jgi:hypothetical protein
MTFSFHISRDIEKAERRKENPCGFQGPCRRRIDQKDLHIHGMGHSGGEVE